MDDKQTQKLIEYINKRKRFSKRTVIAVILLNILFTTAVFASAWHGVVIPDPLIYAWFGFTTGELLALAGIKIKKDGGGNNNEVV